MSLFHPVFCWHAPLVVWEGRLESSRAFWKCDGLKEGEVNQMEIWISTLLWLPKSKLSTFSLTFTSLVARKQLWWQKYTNTHTGPTHKVSIPERTWLIFNFQAWQGWGGNWCLSPLPLCHWHANFCNGQVYDLKYLHVMNGLITVHFHLSRKRRWFMWTRVHTWYFGPCLALSLSWQWNFLSVLSLVCSYKPDGTCDTGVGQRVGSAHGIIFTLPFISNWIFFTLSCWRLWYHRMQKCWRLLNESRVLMAQSWFFHIKNHWRWPVADFSLFCPVQLLKTFTNVICCCCSLC